MSPEQNDKRITILTAAEIKELYSLPKFTPIERDDAFYLTEESETVISSLRRLETKAYYILLQGYFRAKPILFTFRFRQVKEDLSHIMKKYFPGKKFPRGTLSRNTISRLHQKLLQSNGFHKFDKNSKEKLMKRIFDVAGVTTDPGYMFDECLAFFGQYSIPLPGYSFLQEIISNVIAEERSRFERIIDKNLSVAVKDKLRELLHKHGSISGLAQIKKKAKNFSHTEISRELESFQVIKEVFPQVKSVVDKLSLSSGNQAYYSSMVSYYSITKLRRFSEPRAFLYLSCYLHHRYRQMGDNLVEAFTVFIRKHKEAAKQYSQQQALSSLAKVQNSIKHVGSLLQLFVDDTIDNKESLGAVRQRAFKLISKEDISLVSMQFENNGFDKTEFEWKYIESNTGKNIPLLRKLFMAIDWDCNHSSQLLSNQVTLARQQLAKKGKITSAVSQFVRTVNHDVIYSDEGNINRKRFEFYFYQRLDQQLHKQGIYLVNSDENRHLDDDLISKKDWKKRDLWLKKASLNKLQTPISETLHSLQKELNEKSVAVCKNITSGNNRFVVFSDKADTIKWSVAHKANSIAINNPLYDQMPPTDIIDVMMFVDQETGFLSAFKHIAPGKEKKDLSKQVLLGCIMGHGTNYGIHKFSSICDCSAYALRSVNDSYIHHDNLQSANDSIANKMTALPIFKHYTIDKQAPFSSIDGQKFECRINTFKARFSSKYFRKGKGVSAMSLVCNHVPINTIVIGANEYEGHYAFDLLFNNTSDIQPISLSTDSHGTNNVNFALLDLFGYSFAPRYANVKRKFNALFSIACDAKTGQATIKLNVPINYSLIESEWDEIQRIICSLSQKTATQSTLIRKLSNQKHNSRTLAALQEYDRLVKSLYLLDYIDNETLRGYIEHALNRGEAYHQLRRAISSVNGDRFIGGNDYQVSIANECARIIGSCIIYYNSTLLSALLTRFEITDMVKAKDVIMKLSPVAWQHLILNGHYQLNKSIEQVSPAKLVEAITAHSLTEELTRMRFVA